MRASGALLYSPALYSDGWFWLALGLGLGIGWLLRPAAHGAGGVHWNQLAWLALLYPLMEEWFFRGLLQRAVLGTAAGGKRWMGLSVANLVATLLFFAAHLFTRSFPWAVLIAAPSLLFGWFRDRYDSIIPGLVLHCCFNLVYFFPGAP